MGKTYWNQNHVCHNRIDLKPCMPNLAFKVKIIKTIRTHINTIGSAHRNILLRLHFCVAPTWLNFTQKQDLNHLPTCFRHPKIYKVLQMSIDSIKLDIVIQGFADCIANEKKFQFSHKFQNHKKSDLG